MTKRNFELVRKMGRYDVLQRTSDGMFNASALLRQWNATDGNRHKQMNDFLKTRPTQEFVLALRERLFEKRYGEAMDMSSTPNAQAFGLEAQDTSSTPKAHAFGLGDDLLPDVKRMVGVEEVIVVKKNGQNTSEGRVADEVWMHPLFFIKFACWINPRFEVRVLEFVQDQLICYRNRIADSHRKWTDMLQRLGCRDRQYAAIQRDMNLAVFGESYEGIRDHADEEQIMKMCSLENAIEQAVSFGLVKDTVGIGSYLRKVYEQDFQRGV